MVQSPEVSVVLPCYNEAENLEPLLNEVKTALAKAGRSYEVLFVNDGSSDNSAACMSELARRNPCVRVIHHRTNFGQSAAILTGYRQALGQVVITMDSDMQNDPADIPEMLEALEDCDAVCGIRRRRQDSVVRLISSRVANFVRGSVLGDQIHDAGCTFRAIRRNALHQLPAFKGLHRFIPAVLRFHGYRVREIHVNHRPRTRGVSKYGIGNRLFVGIADLLAMSWYRRRCIPPDRYE